MIIALASPGIASSLAEGLDKIERLLAEASAQGAEIVCFPEAYLPGLRGQDFEVWPFDRTQQERVLQTVAQWARTYGLATILGMERLTAAGRQIVAAVIDGQGQMQGYQTKNQLDPTEDQFYVPGHTRRLFEINGLKFGVVICHEGWRYPETVRWAAVRGAKIVFHPHHTGSDRAGVRLRQWGAAGGPYYEKAMMMRSMENTIYFASVNYALRFQESATSLIAPSGRCQAYLPYGQEGVLVQAINVEEATGLLAARYAPERYQEFSMFHKENRMDFSWVYDHREVDWEELSELYRIAPLGEKSPQDLATVFSNSKFNCFVYSNNILVGAGRALADGVDCSYIADVAVHPEYQGLGLGKKIIEKLVALSAGHKKIILYANPGKEGFYRKLGFHKMNTAMAIFRNRQQAIASGLISET